MLARLLLLLFLAAPVAAQTSLSGRISANRTLSAAESPYLVTSSVEVDAGVTLTIPSGVEIQFRENTSLSVRGTVDATDATLTSAKVPAERTTRDWNGVTVHNSGTLNLTNARVEFGSNAGYLILASGGTVTLDGSTLTQSYSSGLRVGQGASVVLANNTTITATEWPLTYYSDADVQYTGTVNLTGNKHNGVLMNYSTSTALTLRQTQVPYVFDRTFTVGATGALTMANGTIHKFTYGGLYVDGTLTVQAGAGRTVFTHYRDDNAGGDTNADAAATAPNVAAWEGLVFRAGSDASGVSNALVRYAGAGSRRGGIAVESASPTIQDTELQINNMGVVLTGPARPRLERVVIGSSQYVPLAMTLDADPVLIDNVLSFRDNRYDAIGLLGGVPTADAVLRPRSFGRDDGTTISNLTYVLIEDLTVPEGRHLTIRPGVVVKGDVWWQDLIVQGRLTAVGTADSAIVFTSIYDDNHGQPRDTNRDGTQTSPQRGNWGGIVFEQTATSTSRLERALIRYGQASRTYYNSPVMIYGSSPTIARVRFESSAHGVAVFGTSQAKILESAFVNVESTPVVMSLKSDPVFTEGGYGPSTIENVGLRALGIMGERVELDVTLRQRSFAGFDNITYVLQGDVIIDKGATLTIPDGIVVKGRSASGPVSVIGIGLASLGVEGALRVLGTQAAPVVFTSLHDDGYGNPLDTEGNGNAIAPDRGQWGVVRFNPTSDDATSLIQHARFRFGHRGLDFVGASPTVENVALENGNYEGIYLDNDAAPVLRDVSISGFRTDPIIMSVLSNPDLGGVTFTSNGSNAIRLHGGDISQDATLRPLSASGFPVLAYLYTGLNVKPGVTLTLQPGTVMKAVDWHNTIDVRGALKAEGTAAAPVVFSHFCDDSIAGDSNNDGSGCQPNRGHQRTALTFHPESDGTQNVLRHFQLRYASHGMSEQGCGVRFYNTGGTIDEARFEQINQCAIGIFDASNPTLANTEFSNVTGVPVYMSMFATPTFGAGVTLSNVGFVGVGLRPETYTQDATVPVRSFAGHDNVTYFLFGPHIVAAGTHLTVPAGLVFKTDGTFYGGHVNVRGRLTVAGTAEAPVVFTHVDDDRYGSPRDSRMDGSASRPGYYSGAHLSFEDVSDDASVVEHAVFAWRDWGVGLQQAAPVLRNSLYDNLNWGIVMGGVATPAVTGNTFRDLVNTGLAVSAVSYPRETTGNTIEGRTLRAIHIRTETLAQDVTLGKKTFAGIANIPYVFGSYTVGSGATLTFEPGVVVKFYPSSTLRVNRGLIAEGGNHPDSTIVFTSIWDDFYGGDTDADSLRQEAPFYNYQWGGMTFSNEALDASLRLKNVVFRHMGSNGLRLESASPTIADARFEHSYNGIMAMGASGPSISNSDFEDIQEWALYNETGAFTIDATGNWWGHASGPRHASNPSGTGTKVSDHVTFSPWEGGSAQQAIAGDVSMNGDVQPYDAALVLQHSVGATTLSALQQRLADVSGNGEATAMDAALILQYSVGLRNFFPIEVNRKTQDALDGTMDGAAPALALRAEGAAFGESVTVALRLTGAAGTAALDGTLAFDPAHLAFEALEAADGFVVSHAADSVAGRVRIALARSTPLAVDGAVAHLTFRVRPSVQGRVASPLRFDAQANERPLAAAEAAVNVEGRPNALALRTPYPNPMRQSATVKVDVPEAQPVRVVVFNALGQRVATLFDGPADAGVLTLSWNGAGEGGTLANGLYLVRLEAGARVFTQALHLVR